jgi:hypothetical protein
MTPEDAVTRLAEIVAPRAEFSEDEIYAAMTAAGIPDGVADRAYKFTQTAWGRAFLAGMGIQFHPDYLCFNAGGDVTESGPLADEPYFAAASRLVGRFTQSPGFGRLALMSADVNAVNNALHAGSKPENLAMGPAALFLEAATPAGLEKARRVLSEHLSRRRPTTPSESAPEKPWWRFWG